MPELRLVPRFLVPCVIAAMIAGCGYHGAKDGGSATTPMSGNPCASGTATTSRQAPIVCIDDTNRKLIASPDPIEVSNVLKSDRKSPVTVQWYTKSGTGDVQVKIEPGCVTEEKCEGRGKCSAKSVPSGKPRCKYDVWIEGSSKHDRLDPTIVITPCCT
jgi:hypothetical protein